MIPVNSVSHQLLEKRNESAVSTLHSVRRTDDDDQGWYAESSQISKGHAGQQRAAQANLGHNLPTYQAVQLHNARTAKGA